MGFFVMLWGAEKLVPAEYWCPYGKHCYNERKVTMQRIQPTSDCKSWFGKEKNPTTFNVFYDSKVHDYLEGLLFKATR